MRLLRIMLSLLVLLLCSAAAKAQFDPANPPEPGVNFTLTTRCIPEDGGYNLTGSGTHAFGSSVHLSVSRSTGYRFVGWEDEEGNSLTTSLSFYYTMPSHNVTLTARFVYDPSDPTEPSTPEFKDEANINFVINPTDGGYFSSNYNGTYEVGSYHNFTARANSGYRFINWTRDDEIISTSTSLGYTVPNGDHTLVANFEFDPSSPSEPGEPHFYRQLSLVSNPQNAATLRGGGTFLDGTSQYLSMTINDYYHFVNWTDENGAVVSENSNFYYTMPNRKVTLTANFTYNYDPSSPTEPGTPNPDGSVTTDMVARPRFGMYDDTHVMILCETQGSTIHYTLDGTDPTTESPVYTDPVFVGSNLLVKAFAVKEGMDNSPIISYQVTAYRTGVPVYIFENKMVKITSSTPDAVIRYTLDFTEPTAESPIYTTPFLPEENCRIKAYASKEGLTDSPVSIYVYRRAEHTMQAPTFSLNDEEKLVITSPIANGVIRYTLDGTEPNESSTLYSGPITLTQNGTVKAYVTHINYFDSPSASYEVTTFIAEAPVISFTNKKVTITSATENAVIRYTLDGNEPTAESLLYNEPFLPANSCTVKAFASKENFNASAVTSYVFNRAEHTATAPTFAIDGEGKLVITPTVEGGVTRYTMDGTEPTAESPAYSAPITLTQNCTVKAFTSHTELLDSPVASYEVTTFICEAPVINFRAKMVEISCASENAVIRYTLDGTEPTAESPVYEAPFLPTADCTIKAFASKANFNNSPVTNYVYNRAEHTASAPTYSLNDQGQLVITATVEGGVTRYTMDGTEPTAESPAYSAPITLTQNCTVKAFTSHAELLDSPVASYEVNTFVCDAPLITFEAKMVEMSCVSENAVIRYTLDGTEPTAESPVYEAPFLPTADCTIKAFASKANFNNSPVTNYVYNRAEHTASAPTFSLNDQGQLVITTTVEGGVTRYTMDGSEPTVSSAVYPAPITLTHNCTVKAYTFHAELLDSPVASYEVNTFYTEAPVITFENRKINIVCPSANSVIRYTLDGSEPNATSQVYSVPFVPENDCEIKASASKANFNNSPVSNYVYNRAEHTATAPVFHLVAGSELVQMFALEPTMENCTIHYTTDGTEPNASSQLYTEPFPVQEEGVVMAIAIRDNYFDSPIVDFNIAEHKEVAPEFIPDYSKRVIAVQHPEQIEVALLINGELADKQAAPFTFEVMPGMTEVSAIALGKAEDRVHSLPQTMPIEFLPIPRLVYNGHDVVVDAPTDNRSAVAVLFNGSLLNYASAGDSFDITEFGTMGAYMLSDFAFRSDPTELAIDVFNTGRIAGAHNGHRLSEAFGTWGDNDEDYDYLMVVGDIAKEDLQFIGSLPRLTSLHLSPDGMPTENCDNVFANSRIETVYSSAYPAGMLKGMPRLTTVMWGGTDTKMPDGRITEAGNPNILLWVTNTDNAPTDASNLVVFESTDEPVAPGTTGIKGSAKTINLIAGYPYNAHKPIEAESIQLTKEFGQTTDIGYTQGWETITLPFAPMEILRDDNYELVPFNQWPGTDDAPRPFWLYTANGSDWEAADGIEAGVPYIISMPNNPEYIYYYNISGPVRFRAKDVSLGTDDSAPQTVDWIESMRFNATFMPVEEANALSLNTHGEGGKRSGSVFIAEAETLPFGAYVTGATRNNIPVFGTSGIELPSISMNSGIIVTSPAPGTIRISSTRTCSVAVTAITGITVAKADIKAGETFNIEGLATGMYIVAGTKIIVK